ncbi:MAG: hypothetical protein U1F37_13150 [Alphaproteobacteria bacterium]
MAEAVAALPAGTKMRDRIAAGIRARLDFVAPHKEAAGAPPARSPLPHNAPITCGCSTARSMRSGMRPATRRRISLLHQARDPGRDLLGDVPLSALE